MTKKIAILGSTGSIGQNTIDVVQKNPDRFEVVALAANRRVQELAEQVAQLSPRMVCLGCEDARNQFRALMPNYAGEIVVGPSGLDQLASMPEVDLLMISLVGSQGLHPLMTGLEHGKDIAFVNKEALVMGGPLVMNAVAKNQAHFIPVDSEHSAIFQCLLGESKAEMSHMTLTSSGGPFREWSVRDLDRVTPDMAIKHPRWNMGPKISVDSATLMNKGLEVIEARWLFDVPLQQIDVIIHPQSIVHSMVEFVDGSIKAHLGVSDMRIPILYALSYPERLALNIPKLDLTEWKDLSFEPVDRQKFPALDMCYFACEQGGTYPAVINAANEVAVASFLDNKISFVQIAQLIQDMLDQHESYAQYSLDQVIQVDQETRILAGEWVKKQSPFVMGGRA